MARLPPFAIVNGYKLMHVGSPCADLFKKIMPKIIQPVTQDEAPRAEDDEDDEDSPRFCKIPFIYFIVSELFYYTSGYCENIIQKKALIAAVRAIHDNNLENEIESLLTMLGLEIYQTGSYKLSLPTETYRDHLLNYLNIEY